MELVSLENTKYYKEKERKTFKEKKTIEKTEGKERSEL